MKILFLVLVAGGLLLGAVSGARAQELKAPAGTLGAGLEVGKKGTARFYGEAGLGRGLYDLGYPIGDFRITGVPLVFGFGHKVLKNLELEARLPIAIGAIRVFGDSLGTAIPGNLYLAGNFTTGTDKFRFMTGGAFAFGPWTRDADQNVSGALLSSILTRYHDPELYMPESLSVVVPARLEFDALRTLLISADVKFSGIFITQSGTNSYAIVQVAPGAAYVNDRVEIGGRIPIYVRMTDNAGTFDTTISGDDKAQLSAEPYIRCKLNHGYLNARFTFNIDDPSGASFSEDSIFSVHIGGGASF